MNVGIVTFYYKNWNFGGQLQARALVRALNSNFGVTAEQIQYDAQKSWKKHPYWMRVIYTFGESFSLGLINGIYYIGHRLKAETRLRKNEAERNKIQNKIDQRQKAFEQFFQETPHGKDVYENDNIKECTALYDCFVCGGDQIWNDWNDWFLFNALPTYCLEFVPGRKRKFSYAPSMPTQFDRNAYLKRLTNSIKKLNCISVREKTSATLLCRIIENHVQVVLDPVLLLTRDQWDQERTPTHITEQYIFCYLLGEGTDIRNAATKLASKLKLPLVTVPHIIQYSEDDVKFGNIQDFTSGPAEFIDLIAKAEIVVTDSYHAAVFSMIYHKEFYVFERNTQVSGGTMNSRIYDFLDEFGLKGRLVTPEQLMKKQTIEPIDYTYADGVLERRRNESFDYLKTALGINDESKPT